VLKSIKYVESTHNNQFQNLLSRLQTGQQIANWQTCYVNFKVNQ
jgi:hypothetical protein